ncbi:hypothetical protein V1478_002609 [Vespula squamosa]|uniref:Uncharacterized protein n=1 Tax=Vespula squamosa TaxID=30214 RepID=A0ABD2BTL4_VESSQ
MPFLQALTKSGRNLELYTLRYHNRIYDRPFLSCEHHRRLKTARNAVIRVSTVIIKDSRVSRNQDRVFLLKRSNRFYLVLTIVVEYSIVVVRARSKEEAVCRRGPHKLWLKRATIRLLKTGTTHDRSCLEMSEADGVDGGAFRKRGLTHLQWAEKPEAPEAERHLGTRNVE